MDVFYVVHPGRNGKPNSLKVMYATEKGLSMSAYMCLNHGGFAQQKAERWLKYATCKDGRSLVQGCNTLEELAEIAYCALKKPKRIQARTDGKYWEILEWEYPTDEEWAQELERRHLRDEKYDVNVEILDAIC
jgi:hypothetical protein